MIQVEQKLIDALDRLIDTNSENVSYSVEDICRALALSRSQLFRVVKAHAGLSISLYIRKRKMLKARDLLANTNLKIAEVTYSVGIDSPQSFTKYFTQEFGVTPSDFRKVNVPVFVGSETIETPASTENASSQPPIFEPVLEPIPVLESLPTDTVSVQTQSPKRFRVFVGVALGILFMLFLGFYAFKKTFKAANTEGGIGTDNAANAIVVMPFKNLGTPQTAIYTEGVMDKLYSSLASIEALRVISKSSAEKSAHKTLPEIAKDLNVNYVLEGKVLQLNNKIQLSLTLAKGSEDRVIWTKNYSGETKNALIMTNNIAQEVVAELNKKLNLPQKIQSNKVPTDNLEAYNLFLQGKRLVQDRDRNGMMAAINKFDAAIALDATFADVYSYKALDYFASGTMGFVDRVKGFRLAEQNALKAIRLDAQNGLAYAVLGSIYRVENKWEQCITTFQIALKYSPNDPQINYWYSISLRSIGQMDKAVSYGTKAITIDPLHSLYAIGLINSYAYIGKFEEARKILESTKMLFRDSRNYQWASGFYFICKKDYKAAADEFKKGLIHDQGALDYECIIAYTEAKQGQTQSAQTFLNTAPKIVDNYGYIAIVYAGLNDKENCLKYLELAAAESLSPDYIKVSPIFTFLHNEPRFVAVLDKLGLKNPRFDFE